MKKRYALLLCAALIGVVMLSPITQGFLASKFFPGQMLLGGKLGKWYKSNPYHKFNEGDILILKARNIIGYGVRPVAVVRGYSMIEGPIGTEYKYEVLMYTDFGANFDEWMMTGRVSHRVARSGPEEQIHFKWNLENQFVKVYVRHPNEALEAYEITNSHFAIQASRLFELAGLVLGI